MGMGPRRTLCGGQVALCRSTQEFQTVLPTQQERKQEKRMRSGQNQYDTS